MSDTRDPSLRRRATRKVVEKASSLLTRGRSAVERVADEQDEPRPAAAADILLMEAQGVTYRELHRRFTERAEHGDAGLASALDALDAMWANIRQLRAGAPALLMTLTNDEHIVQHRRSRFYQESTALLEDAIRTVFAESLGQLALPPGRMAVLVRILLEGLVVELAQAKDADDVRAADQAYADARDMFERFALHGEGPLGPAPDLDPIPLPW